MRKFVYKGIQVFATNMGPDKTVLANSKGLPPITSEVLGFTRDDAGTGRIKVPFGTFALSSTQELEALYKDAIPRKAA